MLDQVEKRICEIIDEHAQEIIGFGNDIWYHAETGFKEFRTSQKLAEGRIGRVIQRCTQVNPAKRYKTVLHLMEAL